MSQQLDPYKVLGVSPDVGQKELASAYRKRAKACHPDLFPNNEKAREEFRLLNKAYDLVDTLQKRKAYDNSVQKEQTKPEPDQKAETVVKPKKAAQKKPQKRVKRAFEAKPIVNITRKRNLVDNEKSKKPLIIAVGTLMGLLLIGAIFENISNNRAFNRATKDIDYLKRYGELREGEVIGFDKNDYAPTIREITYQYQSRNDGIISNTIYMKKKLAEPFEPPKKKKGASKAVDAVSVIDPTKVDEKNIFKILDLPMARQHIPYIYLQRETLNKEKIAELDTFVNCIKKQELLSEPAANCTFSYGQPKPIDPDEEKDVKKK